MPFFMTRTPLTRRANSDSSGKPGDFKSLEPQSLPIIEVLIKAQLEVNKGFTAPRLDSQGAPRPPRAAPDLRILLSQPVDRLILRVVRQDRRVGRILFTVSKRFPARLVCAASRAALG